MKTILFNTAMVRAILDGRKTQTRRVLNPQPPEGVEVAMLCNNVGLDGVQFTNNAMTVGQGEDTQWFQSKYLEGDVLYVRETWAETCDEYGTPLIAYRAGSCKGLALNDQGEHYVFDGKFGEYDVDAWRPSIHMPQWAARLFLRVTDVRVERVQDMTPDAFVAEGMQMDESCFWLGSLHKVKGTPKVFGNVKTAFQDIWDSTVTDPAFNWDANPWVWVYDFERIEKSEVEA